MAIISNEMLRATTGINRSTELEKYLQKEGIRFFHGKHGPWTTVNLLNASKGLVTDQLISSDPIL